MSTIPSSKEEARISVERLVERFRENVESYKNVGYNETQTRREFIDPFFKSLGWDVDNEAGYAEAYKDVVHEDAVKVGGLTKAPDYSFRIGGQRKFFVEAKKPAVDMKKDPEPYYQLRRYAFSAKLPLSILTDFEELAVVDCRIKPSPADKASKGRIRYWHYEEYLDNFDEIYETFSKDAVLKGSFDRYIASAKKKRGTGEVDKEFLKEIEDWRSLLARNIALRNPDLTQRQLNAAVQLTIDRIIFLRICEDRGIEEYGVLHGIFNGKNVYGRLMELFRRADERYNSGLFHFQKEKDRPENYDDLTPGLVIDDKVLKDILKRLYYPDCPYEFSVLPADILGQVYEQFLGKVIRLTAGHRAVVEDKPEVKKAGGVYYTPTYIVDYIVENTVGKLVEKSTPTKAAKLKILDPACGSGSFLIGAFQYLMDWHRDWYQENDPDKWARGKSPRLFMGKNGWQLTTAEKKRILLNNIYGVDIDPSAVEVTKLSLLLKVLEGESAETIGKNLSLFQERALPDLGSNIKCGNSLIGSDFYEGQQMGLMDEEERLRINAFDWDVEFPEVFSGKNPGFDAVIGNPPYVLLADEEEKKYFLHVYKLSTGKPDLYRLFIERSHHLLRRRGNFGFIVPNTMLTIPSSLALRKYLLQAGGLKQIVNFWGSVFEDASVNNVILICIRNFIGKQVEVIEDSSKHPGRHTLIESVKDSILVNKDVWLQDPQSKFLLKTSTLTESLIEKIKTASVELSQVADYTLGMQVYHNSIHSPEEIRTRVYHDREKKDDTYWPESKGTNVERYFFEESFKEYVSYGDWCYNKPEWRFCSEPRLLIREIPSNETLLCCFTNKTHVSTKAVIIIIAMETSWEYLLGVLNSRLIGYYVMSRGEKSKQRLFPRISLTTVRNLPIRKINMSDPSDESNRDQVVHSVQLMLELNQQLRSAKTSHERNSLTRQIEAIDRQIDQLVYELYELTEEEIEIIESSG